MNTSAHNLQLRLDAVHRRIQFGREAVAEGKDLDLSALSGEVQDISEALHTTSLQIDREAVIQDLESIIIDLNSLQRELRARHSSMGGDTKPDDGADD